MNLKLDHRSILGPAAAVLNSEIDDDMFRINVNFGWHALVENTKKLGGE